MVTIIYLRCNDFVLFLLLQQNVFIYLDVTDYLKILDFFFSALFCTVFFCHYHEMIDQSDYYYYNCNGIAYIDGVFFRFWLFKNIFVIINTCYEVMFKAHWHL